MDNTNLDFKQEGGIAPLPKVPVFGNILPCPKVIAAVTKKGIELPQFIEQKILKAVPETLNEAEIRRYINEIRWKVYSAGIFEVEDIEELGQSYAETEKEYNDIGNHHDHPETSIEFKERRKGWKSIVAMDRLRKIQKHKIDEIIGEAAAKVVDYSKYPPSPKNLFENGGGKILHSIAKDSPTDVLLKVLAVTENNHENQNYYKAMQGALEHLIRRYLTDDHHTFELCKNFLGYRDFKNILENARGVLSEGKLGNKTVGYLLGNAILHSETPDFDQEFVQKIYPNHPNAQGIFENDLKPILDSVFESTESHFIGSSVFETFISQNSDLKDLSVLKYDYDGKFPKKSSEQENIDFEERQSAILSAEFPDYIKRRLRELFTELYPRPIIVRSTSHLEDSYGASFAGIYDSFELCFTNQDPNNEAEFEKDFERLCFAVKAIYSTVYRDQAMNYRAENKLINFDEEMGILVQILNGESFGIYHCPAFSGVASSYADETHGPAPDQGVATVVIGGAKQAVDEGGRMIVLSKPDTAPDDRQKSVQKNIVTMNLETGIEEKISLETLLKNMNLHQQRNIIPNLLSKLDGTPVHSVFTLNENEPLKITFDNLCNPDNVHKFPLIMKYILEKLKHFYKTDVDIEYTARFDEKGKLKIKLIQCRPQVIPEGLGPSTMPSNIPKEHKLFVSNNCLSSRRQMDCRYLFMIDPEIYNPDNGNGLGYDNIRHLQHHLGKFNKQMNSKDYFIAAPRRFGSNEASTGVPGPDSMFSNSAGFVEMLDGQKTPSSGTHFYRRIIEKKQSCFHVCIPDQNIENQNCLDTEGLNGKFLTQAENKVLDFIPNLPEEFQKFVKVIDVEEEGSKQFNIPECRFHLAQNNRGDNRQAVLYLPEKGKNHPEMIQQKAA